MAIDSFAVGIEIGKQLIKNAISHLKLLLSILGKDDILGKA